MSDEFEPEVEFHDDDWEPEVIDDQPIDHHGEDREEDDNAS